MLSFLEAVFLSLVEEISLGAAQVYNLGTPISLCVCVCVCVCVWLGG